MTEVPRVSSSANDREVKERDSGLPQWTYLVTSADFTFDLVSLDAGYVQEASGV